MTFKERVYQHYLSLINEKINALQTILDELNESAKNETKSTAGDKHETALAMLQIEQENTRVKLQEATEQKIQLERIDINAASAKIIKGSFIKTDKGYFFVSVALGKITIDNKNIIAISPQSPLGSKMIGLSNGESITMNTVTYFIENIS